MTFVVSLRGWTARRRGSSRSSAGLTYSWWDGNLATSDRGILPEVAVGDSP